MKQVLPHVTGAMVIPLEGEVGPAAVIALQRRIVRALEGGHRRIVVDLGAVSGLGGQTLSLFCGALRFVRRRGATLAIAGGPSGLRRLVARCDLGDVELHPTVHAALTSASAGAHPGGVGGGRHMPATPRAGPSSSQETPTKLPAGAHAGRRCCRPWSSRPPSPSTASS